MVEHASVWHTPSTHDPLHTLPQVPQFCPSAARSTQSALQRESPTRQAQVPAWQYSASAHEVPQAPQLLGLVCTLTHAPPHTVPPVQPQVPAVHEEPWLHVVLQLPQ